MAALENGHGTIKVDLELSPSSQKTIDKLVATLADQRGHNDVMTDAAETVILRREVASLRQMLSDKETQLSKAKLLLGRYQKRIQGYESLPKRDGFLLEAAKGPAQADSEESRGPEPGQVWKATAPSAKGRELRIEGYDEAQNKWITRSLGTGRAGKIAIHTLLNDYKPKEA